jgi:hypothetical protein
MARDFAPVWKTRMSDPITLTAVAELATQLPPAEQKQLAENILRQLASGAPATVSRRRTWREIRGSVPHPLCGEDAQAWVSCSRESEEQREPHRRNTR